MWLLCVDEDEKGRQMVKEDGKVQWRKQVPDKTTLALMSILRVVMTIAVKGLIESFANRFAVSN